MLRIAALAVALVLATATQAAEVIHRFDSVVEVARDGTLTVTLAALYATLDRLEARRWITGRWVEKAGQRRRRHYRITDAGRKVLATQRADWARFVAALGQVAGVRYA